MTNFLYNPDRKSKDQLIAEFVVRTEMLQDVMSDIETSDMTKPEQHYLLVGQRGTGKTTFLLRLKYAIEDNKKLSKWLIPVNFSEEQYNITELANLWEQIAQVLEDYYGFSNIYEQMEQHYEKNNFEEICYDILESALELSGKKVVLLIDNIGDLLKKLDEKEVRRLREILQTKKYIRLVAGSPFYLDSILEYTQPLFEFFKVLRLDGLNKEQSEKLLLKLGDVHGEREKIEQIIKDTPERIETLRILTGGVPRTLGLMFHIFIDHEHESSLKDLVRILDAVTPLYKHRMDDLPTQQQKIIDAVARHWDAISVKELKSQVRMESKVISAQLRQLEKNQIIEKRTTNTKNHIYLLRERFWNIWYLMRYGRKTDSEKVIWLVRFLESWCSNDDFEKRINNYINQKKEGKINKETMEFYDEVYASLKNITSDLRYKLKNNVDGRIAKRIELNEKEVLEVFDKYWLKGKTIDAIMVIYSNSEISFESKKNIYEKIEELDLDEVLKIIKWFFAEGNNEIDISSISLFIDLTFLFYTLDSYLLNQKFEEANSALGVIIDLVLSKRNNELDYEYYILFNIIVSLLFDKKLNMAFDVFNKLEKIKLKDRLKPLFYVLIFLSEGKASESLKNFGEETKKSAEKALESLEKYWSTIDNFVANK